MKKLGPLECHASIRLCCVLVILAIMSGCKDDEGSVPKSILTVTKNGTAGGTISSNPDGLDCGTECSATFDSGTPLTVKASPEEGSVFLGWSGACSGMDDCQLVLNKSLTVDTEFGWSVWGLTVSLAGDGDGNIISEPAGILCGNGRNYDFLYGTQVTLTPVLGTYSTFGGSSNNLPSFGNRIWFYILKPSPTTFQTSYWSFLGGYTLSNRFFSGIDRAGFNTLSLPHEKCYC